jgi:hypothetical protein
MGNTIRPDEIHSICLKDVGMFIDNQSITQSSNQSITSIFLLLLLFQSPTPVFYSLIE